MKKTIIILSILTVLLSSCSILESIKKEEPTVEPPAPAPTVVPDPCAPENIMIEIEPIQDLVSEFQDIIYVANFTPQAELTTPILEMQAIRREMQELVVAECSQAVKSAAINYMNSTINYLAFFMGGESKENVDAGIQNSQVLWQVVLTEFNKLFTIAGVISEDLPKIGNAVPPASDTGIFVSNQGTQGVNVRSQPDLGSVIIASFEPGMQAIGLARNEESDWLLVNLDGTIGWVFAEMVVASVDVAEFPVPEATEPVE